MKDNKAYVLTSWDDTTKLDLKLADLLENYGIKGTFFVVTDWIGRKIGLEDLKYFSEFHEVGAHTISHPHLARVSFEVSKREILESGEILRNKLDIKSDRIPFAYPYGEYSKEHVKIVEEGGYCCARTTEPFHIEHPLNLFKIGVSAWTYPHEYKNVRGFLRVAKKLPSILRYPGNLKRWDMLAKQLFDVVESQGGVFHLFGHAKQIEENNFWDRLAEVLNYIAHHKNVFYSTISEYCLVHSKI